MIKTPARLMAKLETVIPEEFREGTSLLMDSLRKFRRNKMAVMGCIVIVTLFMISVAAKFTAPYSYDTGELEMQNFPPTWYKSLMSASYKAKLLKWAEQNANTTPNYDFSNVGAYVHPETINIFESAVSHLEPRGIIVYFTEMKNTSHLLGTDEIGQDILSRLIYGMRLSLLLALTVTIVSVIIGVSYGAISGYVGGTVDQIMMRIVDFLFGIPFIFLIILLMVFFGRQVFLIFLGLGLVNWIVLARIVRGQVLSMREKEFILAAKLNGVSEMNIIFRHLVPNVLGPVIVFSTLLVPQIMLLEAFLSFIGLGISPPEVSLGIMISDGAAVLTSYSWPIIFPGLIFSILIFCMNFIGDGLRDALDPRLQ